MEWEVVGGVRIGSVGMGMGECGLWFGCSTLA